MLAYAIVENLLPSKVADFFLKTLVIRIYFSLEPKSLLITSFIILTAPLWGHVEHFSLDSLSKIHVLTIYLYIVNFKKISKHLCFVSRKTKV